MDGNVKRKINENKETQKDKRKTTRKREHPRATKAAASTRQH